MRVMLMVDDGYCKQPKFWCRWKRGEGINDTHAKYLTRFKAWWLVEAENAKAARMCLKERPLYGDTGGLQVGVNQYGRILASGGRS